MTVFKALLLYSIAELIVSLDYGLAIKGSLILMLAIEVVLKNRISFPIAISGLLVIFCGIAIYSLSLIVIGEPVFLVSVSLLMYISIYFLFLQRSYSNEVANQSTIVDSFIFTALFLSLLRIAVGFGALEGVDFFHSYFMNNLSGGDFGIFRRWQYGNEMIFTTALLIIVCNRSNYSKKLNIIFMIIFISSLISVSRYFILINSIITIYWSFKLKNNGVKVFFALIFAVVSIFLEHIFRLRSDALDNLLAGGANILDPRFEYYNRILKSLVERPYGDFGKTFFDIAREFEVSRIEIESLLLIAELGIFVIPFGLMLLALVIGTYERLNRKQMLAFTCITIASGFFNPTFSSITFPILLYMIAISNPISNCKNNILSLR